MLRRKIAAAALSFSLLAPVAFKAQTTGAQTATQTAKSLVVYKAPDEVLAKIKDEGMNRSQVMQTLSYLTDVIGPRLTNSPNMKRANEWTRDTMTKWGMQNAHLEAWGHFGRGWKLNNFSAQITAPQSFPLIAYPKAWSPSTKGAVNADVVYLNAKDDAALEKYRGQLKGKIIMISNPRELKANFTALGNRLTDEQLTKMAGAPDPAKQPLNNVPPEAINNYMKNLAFEAKRLKFVIDEGGVLIIDNSSNGSGGTIFVQEASVADAVPADFLDLFGEKRVQPWQKAAESKMLPQVTMASEDYNRLVRMIQQGENVKMSVDLQAQYFDDDPMGYNTIAEIPGTDPKLKDEIVMLGGHMDSWHSGTGATDNGAGVAVVMEAARIIQSLGLKPRRTIRVALWSGEEQGLFGSTAYVSKHFGAKGDAFRLMLAEMIGRKVEQPQLVKKQDYEKLSAYYNLDNGTGKIRGVYMQGNSGVAPIFKTWFEPFKDLGATTLTLSNTTGTDHLPFDAIGLPGFQFIQDVIEYDSRTHHSNQDVFDRIQADDMKQAATIMAAFVYQTAMMDEKLPRK
jgi:carboxypeptidase Q